MGWQSAGRRALDDANCIREGHRFFWVAEVLGAGTFALLGWFLTPDNASDFEEAVYPLLGVVSGFVLVYLAILGWQLALAPYRQRDEARAIVERYQGGGLQILEAFEVPKEYIQIGSMPDEVSMWRVPVKNAAGSSLDVTVTATYFPLLPEVPGWQPTLTLHRGKELARTVRIVAGNTQYFNLIGVQIAGMMNVYPASVDANDGYLYYEDDMFEANEYEVNVVALADGYGVARKFYVWISPGLVMFADTPEQAQPTKS